MIWCGRIHLLRVDEDTTDVFLFVLVSDYIGKTGVLYHNDALYYTLLLFSLFTERQQCS